MIALDHGGVATPIRSRRNRIVPYVEQAIANLRRWPGVTVVETGAGGVVCTAGGIPVARLGGDGVAALHLTRPVIERLSESLCASGLFLDQAEEGWVAMRVDTAADFQLLLALVSLAIKANM